MHLIVSDALKVYSDQPYLFILFKAMIMTAYFGLFCIGEITDSDHVIKAKDVHVGVNKDKLLFVLRSSKTHGKGIKPQQIRIAVEKTKKEQKSVIS